MESRRKLLDAIDQSVYMGLLIGFGYSIIHQTYINAEQPVRLQNVVDNLAREKNKVNKKSYDS